HWDHWDFDLLPGQALCGRFAVGDVHDLSTTRSGVLLLLPGLLDWEALGREPYAADQRGCDRGDRGEQRGGQRLHKDDYGQRHGSAQPRAVPAVGVVGQDRGVKDDGYKHGQQWSDHGGYPICGPCVSQRWDCWDFDLLPSNAL